jgi:hypothetical protein
MYGTPTMTCFKYQVRLYGSETITYLSGYKASTMSHLTDPTPHYRHPSPPVYGSIAFTHLKEKFGMVKLPYLCKKSKGKPVWLWNHHM